MLLWKGKKHVMSGTPPRACSQSESLTRVCCAALQIFNELNARKILDEYNVFQGLHKSRVFFYVIAITIIAQARRPSHTGLTVLTWPFPSIRVQLFIPSILASRHPFQQ